MIICIKISNYFISTNSLFRFVPIILLNGANFMRNQRPNQLGNRSSSNNDCGNGNSQKQKKMSFFCIVL